MKINITKRDKNLIVIAAGILLVFFSYFYGYSILREKKEEVKSQNETLESQIRTLEEISAQKEQYIAQTQEMQESMNAKIQQFPADMISEDIILYIRNLEQKTDSYVHSISTPDKQYVNITVPAENDILSSFEDITGVITDYSFRNDGKVPEVASMQLAQIESDISCSVTYQGFKEFITEIAESENRKSIDNISLTFNENTGDLAGSMTITYYALSGTGREYLQPVISGGIYGIDCIFGGLKSDGNRE